MKTASKTKSAPKPSTPTRRKVGDRVFTVVLQLWEGLMKGTTGDNAGTVKTCEVRERYVDSIHPDYMGKGELRYGCCKKEHLGQGGYGMAYRPQSLFDTPEQATAELKRRLAKRIAALTETLNSL